MHRAAYLDEACAGDSALREKVEALLMACELEKALYELRYELDNRPSWVHVPLAGILRLLDDR